MGIERGGGTGRGGDRKRDQAVSISSIRFETTEISTGL